MVFAGEVGKACLGEEECEQQHCAGASGRRGAGPASAGGRGKEGDKGVGRMQRERVGVGRAGLQRTLLTSQGF